MRAGEPEIQSTSFWKGPVLLYLRAIHTDLPDSDKKTRLQILLYSLQAIELIIFSNCLNYDGISTY